ncbi:hypothetical protein OJAV_G00075290 [Oryzias javanicus]|uniref:Uncharacterized protein n=1 Tax=Oryzias javanicus TaxID=123683 RepID=A0A3S2Q3S4_ORYJA|nr:hypothetical protein OJAV_G00075290 [Oryzias javanicus]
MTENQEGHRENLKLQMMKLFLSSHLCWPETQTLLKKDIKISYLIMKNKDQKNRFHPNCMTCLVDTSVS